MMKSILLIVIILSGFQTQAQNQNVFFGIPYNLDRLKTGDKIIVSLPSHNDGRFMKIEEFNPLGSLLTAKKDNKIKIEINFFGGSSEDDKDYSESLLRSLEKILKSRYSNANYEILAKGATNPIFTMEQIKDMHRDFNTKILYKRYNTRMEISIE